MNGTDPTQGAEAGGPSGTESTWLSTEDRLRLGVRVWLPEHADGTVVVLVHGFGAHKDDPTVVTVAEALRADGHVVVSYTGRGHFESEGECTLGDLEHLDVASAMARAHQYGDRVVLVGTSMGAIAVLRHAAHEPTAGVVTVSSPAEWRLPRTVQSAGAALLTQLPPGRWLARRAFGVRLANRWTGAAPPVELAAAIEAPHAVLHGTGDRFIRSAEAEKLYEAASDPRLLHLIQGMGHAYMPESVPAIVDAVRWALDHEAPS